MTGTKPEKPALPELSLTGAKLATVAPEVLASAQRTHPGRRPAERSKAQKIIDELVKQAHEKWVKSGRPKEFRKSPGGQVTVPAAQVIVVERAIRKAGVLHDLSIRFGNSVESEGVVTVIFRASDKPVKTEAPAEGSAE